MLLKIKNKNLLTENPILASEWHPTKNGDLTPNSVTTGSGKKIWWQCEKGHEWEAAVNNRSKGNGCPYCSGRRATSENNLQVLNPDVAKQWHPTKNGGLTPNDVTVSAAKKVWWLCEQNHEWEATLNSRASGVGCPYCAGKRVCIANSLQTLSPDLAKQWHPTKNGDLTPNDVTVSAGKKVWWMCEQGHEWKTNIAHRTNGTNCPYCSGKLVSSEKNLQVLNPELAQQWHPTKNGDLTPSDVMVSSGKTAWWVCEQAHEWEATIASRSSGNGCPECNKENKTSFPEQAIYFYLQSIFSDTLNRHKYDGKWEIDVFVPSLNLGIEYDGFYYHDENRVTDLEKEKYFTEKGLTLLRVKETRDEKKECFMKDNIVFVDGRFIKQLLDKVIRLCISYISNNITQKPYDIAINTEQDRSKIYELYIQNEKSNSLLSQYPELSKEWHQIKNLSITPDMVTPGSLKRV